MKNLHLRLLWWIFFFLAVTSLSADPLTPSCTNSPYGSNITLTGHSRPWELAIDPLPKQDYGHPLLDARVNDQAASPRLFAPGAATGLQDLTWAGALATDAAPEHWYTAILIFIFDGLGPPKDAFWSVVINYPPVLRDPFIRLFGNHQLGLGDVLLNQASGNNWQRRMAHCYATGTPYQASAILVMNIGGDDLLNFYKKKHTYLGEYLWIRYILNPSSWMHLIFNRRQVDAELEWFWMWGFMTNNQRIAIAVASMGDYHLSDFGGHTGANTRLLLVEEAPSMVSLITNPTNDPPFRLLLYMGDLDTRLAGFTLPYLATRHGYQRVAYLPTYWAFLDNMLRYSILDQGHTFYIPDFTHFSPLGIRQYGRMIAARIVDLAWLPRNPELNNVDLSPIYAGAPVDLSPLGNPGGNNNPPPSGGCDLFCLIVLCYFFHICGG